MTINVEKLCNRACAVNEFCLKTRGVPADFFKPSDVYLCGKEEGEFLVELYIDMYDGMIYKKINEMDYCEYDDFNYEDLYYYNEKELFERFE